MRIALTIFTTAALALAVDDWAAFGARPTSDVSVAASRGLLGLGRRDLLDTAVDANRTLSDCDASDVGKFLSSLFFSHPDRSS